MNYRKGEGSMMRIIAIENSKKELDMLHQKIDAAFPGNSFEGFCDPFLAIRAYMTMPSDLTVFCRNMRIIDGFTFTRTLRKNYSRFTGVMLSEDENSRTDAEKYSLGYLKKPFEAADLRRLASDMDRQADFSENQPYDL